MACRLLLGLTIRYGRNCITRSSLIEDDQVLLFLATDIGGGGVTIKCKNEEEVVGVVKKDKVIYSEM